MVSHELPSRPFASERLRFGTGSEDLLAEMDMTGKSGSEGNSLFLSYTTPMSHYGRRTMTD